MRKNIFQSPPFDPNLGNGTRQPFMPQTIYDDRLRQMDKADFASNNLTGNPPMMGTMGGDGTGEYPLGTGGPRVAPSDPNYIPPGTAGIKPMPPIKQPPMMPSPMPPMAGSDDLFGAPGAGTYDNLMSRSFQEYSSGQSPYEGASSFLMNRPAFDRGARPETSMPSTDMPSYSYSDPGGAGGLAQLQAQQPGLQAQYDQFAQQIQSAQEAAQQQAQQQTDMAASERQALMDRIAALEGQEGPDLDAFGSQLRQDILGQIPEQIDIDALRREITGEVLSVAQQEFPDVTQIRDEVMRLLPEPEQVDVENLRRQIQESIDRGAPPEQIDALRQELQNRIRPVEEQLQGLQESRGSVAEQIGELRGQVGALPNIDIEDIRRRVAEGIDANQTTGINPDVQRQIEELRGQFREVGPRMDPDVIRRLQEEGERFRAEQDRLQSEASARERARDEERLRELGTLREEQARQGEELRGRIDPLQERLAQLRGRLDERPTIDQDAIARRVRESINIPQIDLGGIREQIANLRGRLDERVPAGTAGIKPLPPTPKSPTKTPPRMGTFPPGYRGGPR